MNVEKKYVFSDIEELKGIADKERKAFKRTVFKLILSIITAIVAFVIAFSISKWLCLALFLLHWSINLNNSVDYRRFK